MDNTTCLPLASSLTVGIHFTSPCPFLTRKEWMVRLLVLRGHLEDSVKCGGSTAIGSMPGAWRSVNAHWPWFYDHNQCINAK